MSAADQPKKDWTVELVIAGMVCLIASIGTFIYFENSLLLLVNLAVSGGIGFLLFCAIALFIKEAFSIQDGVLRIVSTRALSTGVIAIFLALVMFGGMRAGFYITPEEHARRIEEKAWEKEREWRDRQAREAAAQKREEQESADFLSSDQNFTVYGTIDDTDMFIRQAHRVIVVMVAHDPSSVTDVQGSGKCMKLRAKKYPNCRYAMAVTFRAKNAFGALVVQKGFVLFDGGLQGIAFISDLGQL